MKRFALTLALVGGLSLAIGSWLGRVSEGPSPVKTPIPFRVGEKLDEIVLVLLVSETCGACRLLAASDLLDDVGPAFASWAEAGLEPVRVVGVDIAAGANDGSDILSRTGLPFDEILLGGGWAATGSLRFMLEQHVGEPAVPQVVVLSRHARLEANGIVSAAQEEVHLRLIGLDEIRRWVEGGMPLPRIPLRRSGPPHL